MSPAQNHASVAAAFTDRVRGVAGDGWSAPAPVEGWTARDVVRHLIDWFPPFLEGGSGVALPPGPGVDEDPVDAWRSQCDAVQALLEEPATAERTFCNPHTGDLPLPEAVERFYVADVFLHTWDLARATGQDERLDEQRCRVMYDGMQPLDDLLRSSGQYGPRVEVPADADVQTKLLGFIGRDPLR